MYKRKFRFFRFFGFENGQIFRFSAEKIKSENLEGILQVQIVVNNQGRDCGDYGFKQQASHRECFMPIGYYVTNDSHVH